MMLLHQIFQQKKNQMLRILNQNMMFSELHLIRDRSLDSKWKMLILIRNQSIFQTFQKNLVILRGHHPQVDVLRKNE
jgi:hypothetical protein